MRWRTDTVNTVSVTALFASFPSPDRGVWHLGSVPIRAYALCIIVGIIVCVWWAERRFVARGGAPGTIMDIAVFAVPFGLVGGRLYHVLTDWEKYFGDGGHPADALKIWQGGLGIWGAISLGALGAWIGARRRGVPLTAVADAAAPGIVVAQAIGRLGNWFNQELYGKETTLPWGLEIFRRIDPDTGEQDTLTGIADGGPAIAIVHPTFLYELLWNLGVAALCVWADRRWNMGRGRVFALYVAGYTAGRFWIELLRVDPATMVFDIRINVITSVVVFAAAVAYLILVRGPREILAPAPAEAAGEAGEGDAERVAAAVPAASSAAADSAQGGGAVAPAGDSADAGTPASSAGSGGSEVPAEAPAPVASREPDATDDVAEVPDADTRPTDGAPAHDGDAGTTDATPAGADAGPTDGAPAEDGDAGPTDATPAGGGTGHGEVDGAGEDAPAAVSAEAPSGVGDGTAAATDDPRSAGDGPRR